MGAVDRLLQAAALRGYPQLNELFNQATRLAGAGAPRVPSIRQSPMIFSEKSTRLPRSSGRRSKRPNVKLSSTDPRSPPGNGGCQRVRQ